MSDSDFGDPWWDDIELSSPAPGVVQHTHAAHVCEGRPCAVHNPSDHRMRDWPLQLIGKQRRVHGRVITLSERTCEHAVGHPDPDSLAYVMSMDRANAAHWRLHGCDGCCGASSMGLVG